MASSEGRVEVKGSGFKGALALQGRVFVCVRGVCAPSTGSRVAGACVCALGCA